jgi:hypothetical protein
LPGRHFWPIVCPAPCSPEFWPATCLLTCAAEGSCPERRRPGGASGSATSWVLGLACAATALLAAAPASADPAWWNRSWSTRRALTFNNAAQAENLVGFPVLVKLDPSRIDYAKVQAAG